MIIKNHGKNSIKFDEEFPIHLSYYWNDFIFKSEQAVHIDDEPINGMILPGEEKEVLVTLKTPLVDKKYFLNFYLLSKKQVIIKPKVNREYLFNLKNQS
jgi:hypothetical protein